MEIFTTITFAGIIAVLTLIFGILVKIIGFPDQIIKNYKRKSTAGLSTKFIILSVIVYSLWTLHGFLQKDWVLFYGQGLGILTTGFILFQIIYYKRNNKRIPRN
jgi:uncharacterized protein with PQ loop repeat